MNPYDVVIFSGKKDAYRSFLCVDSLQYLVPQPQNVYFVTPNRQGIPEWKRKGVIVVEDKDVVNLPRIGQHGNWLFQQVAKLTQNVSVNDWYLVVDSDLAFMRPFHIWNGNHPILYRYPFCTVAQCYIAFSLRALGLCWVVPVESGFQTHLGMLHKKYCKEILTRFTEVHPCPIGHEKIAFYRFAVEQDKLGASMCEWELYANYVSLVHPNVYSIRNIFGRDVRCYTLKDIQSITKMYEDQRGRFDVMTIHLRLKNDSY